MENNKRAMGGILDSFRRKIQSKHKGVPQEAFSSSMTTTNYAVKVLWRPNNYRRKLTVKTKDNSTIKVLLETFASSGNLNHNKHTKLISLKNYKGITIQYGKKTLTGIFSQNIIHGHKEIYLIEANNVDQLDLRIKTIRDSIQTKIDIALNSFAKRFKINLTNGFIIWDRYEDFIKGEDYIDKIPKETIVHDTYFKKVYGEGIEFKNTGEGETPTANMKKFIKNRVIENFAPEISKELKLIRESINPLMTLKQDIKTPEDIIKNKERIAHLTDQERKELGQFAFKCLELV